MATITPFIRTTTKGKEVNIRFRVRDGRTISLFHTSDIKVNPDFWDNTRFEIKAKVSELSISKTAKNKFNKAIQERKTLVTDVYQTLQGKNNLTSKLLDVEIDKILYPDKYKNQSSESNTLITEIYKKYINELNPKPVVLKQHDSLVKMFKDFAKATKIELTFENVTPETLKRFEKWLIKGGCSLNGISPKLKKLKSFYKYAIEKKHTSINPFDEFKIKAEQYGTPIMLTKPERDYLRDVKLTNERLTKVRDLFILQCLIGCRVGDFFTFRKENIINGTIEYIAEKTKKENAKTIRVPLSPTAKQIIKNYNYPDGKLMPFISEVKYNLYLKELFELVELTRPVSWLNPKTRMQEIKPLNKFASSHLARRTFVGIAHKAGLKNEVIASMSGHVANSRAFERYYAIDEKQKLDAINLID